MGSDEDSVNEGRTGLRGDIARLLGPQGTHEGRPSLAKALQRIITRPGPLAIALYRASHALWRKGLHTLAEVIWRLNLFLTGADIHPGAEIGGGLRITHTSGIVVGNGAKIGSNVTLLHEVTLGGASRAFFEEGPVHDGLPQVGDGSKIGAGAKLLGPIHVGRNVFIGANAVVSKDLPDGTVYTPGRNVRELEARVAALEEEIRLLKGGRGEEPDPASSLRG